MNECTFLTIAQQGRSSWEHYLMGLLSIFLTVFVPSISIPIALLILSAALPNMPFAKFFRNLEGQPTFLENTQVSLALLLLVGIIFLVGIYIAVTYIHQRAFLTLVSADASIQWSRAGRAFIYWLGLWVLNIAILALVQPQRYVWVFRWNEWWPVLLWAPLILLAVGAATSLLYAYIIQGLGLFIRRPVRLAMIWGVSAGLISTISDNVLGIEQVLDAIMALFLVWLVLKDDRLELLMGIFTANIAMGFLAETTSSTLKIPGLFRFANATPDAVAWICSLIQIVLFYLLCFGWPSHPFSLTGDRPPSRDCEQSL